MYILILININVTFKWTSNLFSLKLQSKSLVLTSGLYWRNKRVYATIM